MATASVRRVEGAKGENASRALPLAHARVRAVSDHLWLLLVITLGSIIRLATLQARSLWNDEIISVTIASHPLGEILRARLRIGETAVQADYLYTNNPPLHLIILHAAQSISRSEVAYRLPFALAGIATIPIVFFVLKRLFRNEIAISGTVLFAFSPLHVGYSQEARPSALLVLFSLAGLLLLLRAVESGGAWNWVGFAIVTILNVWSSYFALLLVAPMFCLIGGMHVIQSWRLNDQRNARQIVFGLALSLGAVALSAVPLIADLRATSEMNSVAVGESGPRVAKSLLSIMLLIFTANPIPQNFLTGGLVALFFLFGVVQLLPLRSVTGTIALIWITVPLIVLGIVDSKHVLEMRYILFVLPVVIAITLEGLFAAVGLVTRRSTVRVSSVGISAVSTLLVVLSLIGLTVQPTRAISGQPIKPDWKAVVEEYTAADSPESCLILVDGSGHAMFEIVGYYLGELETDTCAIDARDPRLLEIVSTHSDLWWGIGTQFYPEERVADLTSEFGEDADVSSHFLTVLIHPEAHSRRPAVESTGTLLTRAIEALEPVGSAETSPYPSFRESFVNLALQQCGTATSPAMVSSLLDGYLSYDRINSDLTWQRAEDRLARGDTEGARILALRLIGLSPGNPEAYRLLAEIEQASGGGHASSYAWAATILRSDSQPVMTLDLTMCGGLDTGIDSANSDKRHLAVPNSVIIAM